MLILSRSQVEALLDVDALLVALRDGFAALAAGEVNAPPRNEVALPGGAFLLGMPGRLRDGPLVVKVVTVFESNRDLPTHLATIGIYDPGTGACLAFMDGTYITAIRTSAAAAVATDMLAREDATTLAIIGAGVQGEHHLKTFPRVREFADIRIASLYREDAERLAATHPHARATTIEEAVRRRRRRRPRHPRRAAGHRPRLDRSPAPTSAPSATTRPTASCHARCSTARRSSSRPRRRSRPRPSAAPSSRAAPARCSRTRNGPTDDEITVYKAMGHVMEDIVAATLVYEGSNRTLDRLRSVPVKSLPVQMTKTARPTLATVADALGVSRMTVSNAFNRPDQLSPELREKVLATAQELGYSGPNPIARTLSRGRTGSIGVIIDAPLTLAFSDPAAVEMLHGVATVCEERELGLSLVPQIPGRDAALIQGALVDGFVVYCIADNDPRLEAIVERRLPYALIDNAPGLRRPAGQHRRPRRRARRPPSTSPGSATDASAIVLGWEDPEPERHYVARERLAGWREGFEAAGIDWDSVPLGTAPGFDRETGRQARRPAARPRPAPDRDRLLLRRPWRSA